MSTSHDWILVGGGLANGLLALALAEAQPGARVVIVERDARLGGNHTWSFHESDVGGAQALVAPLVVQRWAEHEVRFPDHQRVLRSGYATISSERLDQVLRQRLPAAAVRTGQAAQWVAPGEVLLAGGERLTAPVVVEATGPREPSSASGWQKFVGLELELDEPVAPARPLLMDATVPQLGGFRFVYVLPLSPSRVLVEDTVFSVDPRLDHASMHAGARAWAVEHGLWGRVVREEQGVLPLPLLVDLPVPLEEGPRGMLIHAGYGGGWFHPTTGYSLPVALRLARAAAAARPDELADTISDLWVRQQRQMRYAALLNRLLFEHFAPEERWHVLARFYRLPQAAIQRFYALETTALDRARILCGRPPRGMRLFATRLQEAR